MATSHGAAIARQLRLVLEAGPIHDLSDGQLLDLFGSGRADRRELAFAAVVERHGPMVRAVARGILGSRPDADDAFQATFLVLSRKAADLTGRDTVGPWLFQVARRTALAARRAEARRRRLDQTVDRPSPVIVPDPELFGIVHEEVARLPDRDRAVVILCDLEGESLDQAARVLGCPVGTVKSRLSRARDRLRRGLQRRGLDGSPLVPLGLAPALPTNLVDLATTAAIRFASWSPLATSVAAHLARGVIRTMSWNRCLHSAVTVLVTTLAVSIGTAWLAAGGTPPEPMRGQTSPPPRPDRPEVATFTVVPEVLPESISAGAIAAQPPGMNVTVDFPIATRVLTVSPPGLKVKKGEVIFRLDPAPIHEGLAKMGESLRSLGAEVDAAEAGFAAEQSKLETLRKQQDNIRRETEAQQVRAEQSLVDRAEARVKRYREASEQAERLAIDPNDPKLLPALVARLELLDRLDSAESDLNLKRKQFEQARRVIHEPSIDANPEIPAQTKLAKDDSTNLRTKREDLKSIQMRRRQAEESLERCTVLSPADGIVATNKFVSRGERPSRGTPPLGQMSAPNNFNPEVGSTVQGSGTICRILTSEHADQEILLSLVVSKPLRYLKPNDTVLFKSITDGLGTPLDVGALQGKFIELTQVDRAVSPRSRGSSVNPDQFPMGKLDVARIRFDTPIALSAVRSAQIEYRVELPTGQVRIPARALAGDRVAVKQPDGRFQWREVEVFNQRTTNPDDKVTIRRLLAVGETIALDPWSAMGETPPKAVEAPQGTGPASGTEKP